MRLELARCQLYRLRQVCNGRLADSRQIFTCRNRFQTNDSTFSSHDRSKFKISKVSATGNMSTGAAPPDRARSDLREIFNAGVEAVLPRNIVEGNLKINGNKLFVGDDSYDLKKNIYLVGFGKAVMSMAPAVERVLGNRLIKGIVSVPKGSKESIWNSQDFENFPKLSGPIEYREGSTNNQPDTDSLSTTDDIIDMVESLTDQDTLIVLVSGGGSALLCMPRPLLDLREKQEFCRELQNAGADIIELNTVRKKLSMVKGGGLARLAYPATVISLIISDIVGDPIDLIASGPTVYSTRPPEEVANILKKYNMYDSLEGDLKTVITAKDVTDDKALLNENKQFKHVHNVLIGNNLIAMKAAKSEALKKGLSAIILRNDVHDSVQAVSLAYAKLTSLVCLALEKHLKREAFFEEVWDDPVIPLSGEKVDEIYNMVEDVGGHGIILIGGGEPTVVVKGKGKGGRNQELALYFSLDWFTRVKQDPRLAEYEVVMLSGGTDGQDGPTDAAGAFGYAAIGPIIFDLRKKLRAIEKKEMLEEMNKKMAAQPLEKEEEQDPCKTKKIKAVATDRNVEENVQEESTAEEEAQENVYNDPELLDPADLLDLSPIQLKLLQLERLVPQNTLRNNDTYNFYSRFKRGQDFLKIGLTGTNVMDLHIVRITKRQCGCRVDFTKGIKCPDPFDEHDLDTDLSNIERRPKIAKKVVKEPEYLNLRILDSNLADPCCNKKRKH